MTDVLFLDIENDGPRLLLVGYALNDGMVRVAPAPYNTNHARDLGYLEPLLDPNVIKVTQSDHDLRHFLMHDGIHPAGPWQDTKVMAWVLDENQPMDQESLTKRYVGHRFKVKRLTRRQGHVYFDVRWDLARYESWPPKVKAAFAAYNAEDVETLRLLWTTLMRELHGSEWLPYWETEEVPYSSVLLRMETRGLPVNLEKTKVLADEVRGLAVDAERELREDAGLPPAFNLNSPLQLRQYLFTKGWFQLADRLPMAMDPLPGDDVFVVRKVARDFIHGHWIVRGRGLAPTSPPRRKDRDDDTGQPSTASPELLYKHSSDPWVQKLCLEYRRHTKLLGTYLDKFPKIAVEVASVRPGDGDDSCRGIGAPGRKDGAVKQAPPTSTRIFGRFNQTGTVTGRLSSSDPNLQNIPSRREMGKRVRGLFEGNFVIGDYDALEMRLMAHFSQDPQLLRVFRLGQDPHALTAKAVFGYEPDHDDPKRDIGKTLNYAIGYGAGAKRIAQTLSLAGYPTDQATAKEYLDIIQGFYSRLYRWKAKEEWNAKQTGYVNTIGGRARRLGGSLQGVASWKMLMYGLRQTTNAKVQGSAADIMRRVMLRVDAEFPELPMLAQIHDELLLEWSGSPPTSSRLAELQTVCERGHGFDLSVPLVFVPAVCTSWAEKGGGSGVEPEAVDVLLP